MTDGGAPSDLATAEPGEGRVSTLELFFDLVFVFGFTQITGAIVQDPTAVALGRGVLVFAMLWWAWGAYAWLTNTVATDEHVARLVVFAAMGAMLVTALGVPTAFSRGGVAFALGYLVVMVLHAVLFVLEGENPQTTRGAILRLVPTNLGAAGLLVVAGTAQGTSQTALWLGAVLLSYLGPYVTGVAGFTIHPGHFVERHGLIVIVALGESIVAVGAGNEEITLDWALAGTGLLVIALVIGLWWAYFAAEADRSERTLARLAGAERARFARDVYSYLHIPLVLGVVLAAVGIHEVLEHPGEPLDQVAASSLGAGVAMFIAALVVIRLRRGDRAGVAGIAAVAGAAAMVAGGAELPAAATLAVLAALTLGMQVVDRVDPATDPATDPIDPDGPADRPPISRPDAGPA
jgi:low temperature requirement protein LtrA